MKTLLEIQDVAKEFGGLKAIDGCSFNVEEGSITGLIGPNGAGKTTLFNVLAGAFPPSRGQVIFDGENINNLRADERFHKGLVRTFQIPHEFGHLTALENLMVVAPNQPGESLVNGWFRQSFVKEVEWAVKRQAQEVLEFLEISHVARQYARKLSGGQKKLLELGRTMMTDARLVLLDEPAAGVNRTLLKKLAEKIRILNEERGYTFILIEHDMELIEKLCDPVICMAEGKVLVQGDFNTVVSNKDVLEAYMGSSAEVSA